MSRHIDADKLLKSAVSKFKCIPLIGVTLQRNGEECFDGENFEEFINEVPTADVVEVVRCKDCAWYNSFTLCCGSTRGMFYANPNGYCSYGERRENDNT